MSSADAEPDSEGSEVASGMAEHAEKEFVRHQSVVRNVLGAMDLVVVCNDICCRGTRYHCPLCHNKRFSPTTQQVVMQHLQSVHYGNKVDVYGLWQCMQCCLKHDGRDNFPHYHSPYCMEKFRSVKKLMAHVFGCNSARADPDMEPHIMKLAQRSRTQPSRFEVSPAERLLGIEKMKEQVGKFYHQSLVFGLCDLELKQCDSANCCQGRYHCPLCPTYMFRPNTLVKLDAHLDVVHWKLRVTYGEIIMLKCTMTCIPSEEGTTMGSTSHWHCPLCSRLVTARRRIVHHLQSHERGTAWEPGINMVEVSEVASVVDEPAPSPKEKAPPEVFDVVAVMVNQELMNMIPGSRDLFFQYLQLATGVQYTINNKTCMLQGKWDVVRSVQALLDQIRMMRPSNMEQIEGLMEKKLGVKFVGGPDEEETSENTENETNWPSDTAVSDQVITQDSSDVAMSENPIPEEQFPDAVIPQSETSDEPDQLTFTFENVPSEDPIEPAPAVLDDALMAVESNLIPSAIQQSQCILSAETGLMIPVASLPTTDPNPAMDTPGQAPAAGQGDCVQHRSESPAVTYIEVCPAEPREDTSSGSISVSQNPVNDSVETVSQSHSAFLDNAENTLPDMNQLDIPKLENPEIERMTTDGCKLNRGELDSDMVDAVSAITQLAHRQIGVPQENIEPLLDNFPVSGATLASVDNQQSQGISENASTGESVSYNSAEMAKSGKAGYRSTGRKALTRTGGKVQRVEKEPTPSTSGWRSPRIRARKKIGMGDQMATGHLPGHVAVQQEANQVDAVNSGSGAALVNVPETNKLEKVPSQLLENQTNSTNRTDKLSAKAGKNMQKASKEPTPSTSGWRSPRVRARDQTGMGTQVVTDLEGGNVRPQHELVKSGNISAAKAPVASKSGKVCNQPLKIQPYSTVSTQNSLSETEGSLQRATKQSTPSTSGRRSRRGKLQDKIGMENEIENNLCENKSEITSKKSTTISSVKTNSVNISLPKSRKRKSSVPESLAFKEAKSSAIPSASVGIMHRIRTPSRKQREADEYSLYSRSFRKDKISKQRSKHNQDTQESPSLISTDMGLPGKESCGGKIDVRANPVHTVKSETVSLTQVEKTVCGSRRPVIMLNRVDVLLYDASCKSSSPSPQPTPVSNVLPTLLPTTKPLPQLTAKPASLSIAPPTPLTTAKTTPLVTSPQTLMSTGKSTTLANTTVSADCRRSSRTHKPSSRLLESGINLEHLSTPTELEYSDEDDDYKPDVSHIDLDESMDSATSSEEMSQSDSINRSDVPGIEDQSNNDKINTEDSMTKRRPARTKKNITYCDISLNDSLEELCNPNKENISSEVKHVEASNRGFVTDSENTPNDALEGSGVVISHEEGFRANRNSAPIGQISVKEEQSSPEPSSGSWNSAVWGAFEKAAATGVLPAQMSPKGSSRRKGSKPTRSPRAASHTNEQNDRPVCTPELAGDMPVCPIKKSESEVDEGDVVESLDSTPRINLECNEDDGSYLLTVSYPEEAQTTTLAERNARVREKMAQTSKCSMVKFCRQCPICARPFTMRNRFHHHVAAGPCNKKALANLSSIPEDLAQGLVEAQSITENVCPYCDRKFNSLGNTHTHVLGRVCRNPSRCDVDTSQFKKDPESGHVLCNFCDFKAAKPMYVVSHIRRIHWEKKHICPVCGTGFGTASFLKGHMKWNHGTPTEMTTCSVCHKDVRRRQLKQHLDTHTVDNVIQKPKRKYVALDVPMKCSYCKYTTRHRNMYHQHVKRHHSEKDKACPFCEKSFALQVDLNHHLRRVHTLDGVEAVKEQCPYCSKEMLKKNLTPHIRQVHEKIRRFKCSICQGKFATKFTLMVHMEHHKPEDERMSKYLCPVCGKKFINKTSFTDHVNLHTGDKPHQCNICGKRYRQAAVLRRHRESHKGIKYACSECGNMYGSKKYLLMHQTKHNPVKRHTCICGKEFLTPQGVDTHRYGCRIWQAQQQVLEAQREHAQKTDDGTPGSLQAVISVARQQEDNERAQATLMALQAAQETDLGVSVEDDNLDDSLGDGQVMLIQDEDGNILMLQPDDDPSDKEHKIEDVPSREEVGLLGLTGLSDVVTSKGTQVSGKMHAEELPLEERTDTEVPVDLGNMGGQGGPVEEGDQQYLCGYCQQLFPSLDEVQTHMLTEHLADLPATENGEVQLSLQLADAEDLVLAGSNDPGRLVQTGASEGVGQLE